MSKISKDSFQYFANDIQKNSKKFRRYYKNNEVVNLVFKKFAERNNFLKTQWDFNENLSIPEALWQLCASFSRFKKALMRKSHDAKCSVLQH